MHESYVRGRFKRLGITIISVDHEGVTEVSKAGYLRLVLNNLILLNKVKQVFLIYVTEPSWNFLTYLVTNENKAYSFSGFSWGYYGEGSRGLEWLLKDQLKFDLDFSIYNFPPSHKGGWWKITPDGKIRGQYCKSGLPYKQRKYYKQKMTEIVIDRNGDNLAFTVPLTHKERFEKNHGTGSLTKLYRMLLEPCNTFTQIGEHFGLSRERPRQIYKSYLSQLLPQKSGRERSKICTFSRPHVQFPNYTLEVWREARRQGLSVSYVNRESVQKTCFTYRKRLLINNKLCGVAHTTNSFQPRRSICIYTRVQLSRTKVNSGVEYLVIYVNVSSAKPFFVILPHEILPKLSDLKSICLYIPVYHPLLIRSYNQPLIDWSLYKNAWSLLKQDEETTPTRKENLKSV